jgi:hypothetical protein
MNDKTILDVPCQCGSGKPLGECHGKQPTVEVAPPAVTRKLDLACGQTPCEGFEGVDVFPGAQHVVDLQKFPWPFADNSIAELHCSHYIEHIPARPVDERDLPRDPYLANHSPAAAARQAAYAAAMTGKDHLFAFFDECYRILEPDGWLTVQVPAHCSDRAFQDPTHRRFITVQTFGYMNYEWRKMNRLDHYNVDCHFISNVVPIIPQELGLRAQEYVNRVIVSEWNRVIDWRAKLQKKARP